MSSSLKPITIMVNRDFKIPAIYASESVDDIQDALWIGATVQNQISTHRADGRTLEIQDVYEKKISDLRESLTCRIKGLESDRLDLDAKYVAALRSARAEAADGIRRELEDEMRSLEQQMKCLDERRRSVEESRSRDIAEAVSIERIAMERLVSEKEKDVGRMEAILHSLQDAIGRQGEEIRSMIISKRINCGNVKIKGSLFETEFHERLVEAYGTVRDFDIRDTAHGSGHEGDSIMTLEGEQIMWELKDYGSDVPKKEVDKFLRDMLGCKGARIGVMVSKSTGIIGKHGALTMEIHDGRLLLFVNRYEEWSASGISGGGIFHILLQIFRLWWKTKGDECDSEDETQKKLEENFLLIQKYVAELKTRRTEWRTHKGRMEEVLRWVGSLLDDTGSKLERVLRGLGSEEDGSRGEDMSESTIFIETEDKRSNEWIQTVLGSCNIGDGWIELQELEGIISGVKRMSRDTVRGHILKIIVPGAIEKRGAKKVIVGLVKK
jgi:hypothetical protein